MAIKFEKIVPGMTLYDVRRNTGLNSYRFKWSTWPVYVKEVDSEKRRVLASWNGNPYEWHAENWVTRLRANKPSK